MKTLEQILADAREDAAVLDRTGHAQTAQYIVRLVGDVSATMEEWLRWLSEDDARLRSGLSRRALRRRFREWVDAGHARYNLKGEREYRMAVVPSRADVESARSAGRRGERRKAS